MAYLVNTTAYNNDVASVVNTNNTKIKTAITDFNTELNVLANGETWKGTTAIENVGALVDCYNTYKNSYSDFITKLEQTCSTIFSEFNSIIATNNGVPLTFDNIKSLSFEEPVIKDMTYTGEGGDADRIITCAQSFTQYAADIKSAYQNIKTAFEKIGAGSLILDTSDLSSDPATALKNKVSSIIDSLVLVDEQQFKTVIDNLNTAANNIKNG